MQSFPAAARLTGSVSAAVRAGMDDHLPGPSTAAEIVAAAVEGAPHLYLGVASRHGPHVTPELFGTVGTRLVCMAAHTTLKVDRIRRHPVVGLAAAGPAGSLAALCRATVLDAARPADALASPVAAAAAPLSVARFVAGNLAELTGALEDAVRGRLGAPPPRRVVLELAPLAATLVTAGSAVESAGWDDLAVGDHAGSAGADPAAADADADVDAGVEAGPDLHDLVTSGPAVLGWTGRHGETLCMPVEWDAAAGRARLARGLAEAVGAAERSRAAVTFDTWTGHGPTGKRGVMLRGSGRLRDGGATAQVEVERLTTWEGVVTATERVGDR